MWVFNPGVLIALTEFWPLEVAWQWQYGPQIHKFLYRALAQTPILPKSLGSLGIWKTE